MTKFARVFVVCLVMFGMVVNPVHACRFFGGHWRSHWRSCNSGGYGCGSSCCGEVVVEESSCGCEETATEAERPSQPEPPVSDDSTQSVITPPVTVDPVPPIEPTPVIHEPELDATMPANIETPAEAPEVPVLPPAVQEPSDELFSPSNREVEPTVPAEEPAEEQPATDLFSEPATEEPAEETAEEPTEEPTEEQPAEAPAEESPSSIDDLFGAPDESGEPADTEQPAEQPAEEESTEEESAEEQPADESPAEEQPTDEEPVEEDLFGPTSAILGEPGGFASDELRQWVDNTGRYTTHARLIRVIDGQVRLMKDNGRTTTVPFHRLSSNDLRFVERQASAHRIEAAGQTVQNSP